MIKRIAILGSTGSIGRNTLAVIDQFPHDFEVVGLTAGNNIELLSQQVKKYRPGKVAVFNSYKAKKLKSLINSSRIKVFDGLGGLNEIAAGPADIVVAGMSGSVGLIPTLEAVKSGKVVALANKEPMVMAGDLVMNEARRSGARIIPVDSEHNALFQCLEGKSKKEIASIVLTCSGGPFYQWSKKKLSAVTPSMALRHPRWKMGRKITIDSATLMNKGLEIIEATYLFGVDVSQVKVVVHPEAMIHGLVEFIDGMLLALLGQPDMRLPIQYALWYPQRQKNTFPALSLEKTGRFHFFSPDESKFPCLGLAKLARKIGGTMTAVLNGANEAAVEAFLKRDIKFLQIPSVIETVMERHMAIISPSLEEILCQDKWAKEEAKKVIYE